MAKRVNALITPDVFNSLREANANVVVNHLGAGEGLEGCEKTEGIQVNAVGNHAVTSDAELATVILLHVIL